MVHWMTKPRRRREARTITLSNATINQKNIVELKSPKKLILDTDKKAERSPSVFQYVFFS